MKNCYYYQDQSSASGMQTSGNPMGSFFQSGNPPYSCPYQGYQNQNQNFGNYPTPFSTNNNIPNALSFGNNNVNDKNQKNQYNQQQQQSMPMMQPYPQGFQQQQQQQPYQYPQASYQMNQPYQYPQYQQPMNNNNTTNMQYQPLK